jgi:glycosyltransferase involved in cell wall biosynthesis
LGRKSVPVSLIMTVRNEEDSLPRLFDSLVEQTVQPGEVVVVDGGSTDRTVEVARLYEGRLPVRVIMRPGANISEGRNAAIEAARFGVIAATDAGVWLDPRWLEELTAPLLDEASGVDVVSGWFAADPRTPFERAMGATVLPALEEVDPGTFLPSSRSVAFRKEAWREVGGYPEWLDYCEDLVFDFTLREQGKRFDFAADAVAHFRPRPDLYSFYLQYYRYAQGDGKADLWRKRHAIRYATYTLGPAVAAWSWADRGTAAGKLGLLGIAAAAAAYTYRPYRRLLPMLKALPVGQALYALAIVPVIRLVGDVAKMAGYPVGVLWRLRRRVRP